MAAKTAWYGNAQLKALTGNINWMGTSNIKAMLCTSSYVPNQNTHIFKSHITSEVASGNGYTEGGVVLANRTIVLVPSNGLTPGRVVLNADNALWTDITVVARYCVIYDNTNALDSAKPLIGYFDFGQDREAYQGDLEIVWSSDGCFYTEISLPA